MCGMLKMYSIKYKNCIYSSERVSFHLRESFCVSFGRYLLNGQLGRRDAHLNGTPPPRETYHPLHRNIPPPRGIPPQRESIRLFGSKTAPRGRPDLRVPKVETKIQQNQSKTLFFRAYTKIIFDMINYKVAVQFS